MILSVPARPLGTFFMWLNVSPELLQSQSSFVSIVDQGFNAQGVMTKYPYMGFFEE